MGWKRSVGSGFLKHKSEHVTSMLNALQLPLHCLQESTFSIWMLSASSLALGISAQPMIPWTFHVFLIPASCFALCHPPPPRNNHPHLTGWENSFSQPHVQKFPSPLTLLNIPAPVSYFGDAHCVHGSQRPDLEPEKQERAGPAAFPEPTCPQITLRMPR